ncbi:MAG: LSU ribosomal protein L36p @ LSU ribosomal protein L36p, zinc-dependent, partial [uncultured Solirubrobacterales bacterium]
EGPSFSQAHVREVQDRAPSRRRARDLPQSATQAEARI